MWLYMSTRPIPPRKDKTTPNFDQVLFNRRGRVGPGDDVESFIRRMAEAGHHAFLSETDLGDRVRCDAPDFSLAALKPAPRGSRRPAQKKEG